MQQGGLAGTVGAEYGHDLALGHVERDVAERVDGAVPRGDAAHLERHLRRLGLGGGDFHSRQVAAFLFGALVADAQVGLDDGLVGLDDIGFAVRDALAVVEHRDPVAKPHDQLDVVLDEQHGDTGVADATDAVHEVLALRSVHARGRLVEQEEPRLGGKGTGDLDEPLLTVGKTRGRLVRNSVEADQAQGVHRTESGRLLFAPLPR